jgi:3-hydroxyacyl-[acyl-carrier-protein] dehydratase
VRFTLIDEILDLEIGKRIVATKTFWPEEEFFQDHFPGFPVVPGVLLTEMMAQAAGKCLHATNPERGKAMLAQIKNASFRRWVSPAETAIISCCLRPSAGPLAAAHGSIEVGEQPVCDADLIFAFMPASTFDSAYRDDVLDRFLAARR